jgi:hypothetical protein
MVSARPPLATLEENTMNVRPLLPLAVAGGFRGQIISRNRMRSVVMERGRLKRWAVLLIGILVCWAPGVARGDFIISGQFAGVSDKAAYSPDYINEFLPLSSVPFQGNFSYTDDGTTSTFSAEVVGPSIMGPDAVYPISYSESDGAIAAGNSLMSSIFYVDSNNVVHINTAPLVGTYLQQPFDLTATGQLGPNGALITSTFSGHVFEGGEYAYLDGSFYGTPEPATLISGGIAVVLGLACSWRRRKRSVAA